MDLSLPRGVKDFDVDEAYPLLEIIRNIERVYRAFGFQPLITPNIETLNVLNSKFYGSDSLNEIFSISNDQLGLRYDHTVPLARYIASRKDLPMPFKRYAIGYSWRKEEPQFMREREFIQADVDIVGSKLLISDAEVIAASSLGLESAGIEEYEIHLNNRILLNEIISNFNVKKENEKQVIRLIDKIEKKEKEEIIKELRQFTDKAEELIGYVLNNQGNDEILARISNDIKNKEVANQIAKLLDILKSYSLKGDIIIDLSLARGLDYYTSFVWEFKIKQGDKKMPSIGGGGRYDSLISNFANRDIPAVGSSIGVNRLYSILNKKEFMKRVYLIYIKDDYLKYAINIANILRGNNINVDLAVSDRSLSKQLEYASNTNANYVIIIGEQEVNENKIKLRNMITGEEELISLDDAINKLR